MKTTVIPNPKGKGFVIARDDGLLLDSYMDAHACASGAFTLDFNRKHFWNKRGFRFKTKADATAYQEEWFNK